MIEMSIKTNDGDLLEFRYLIVRLNSKSSDFKKLFKDKTINLLRQKTNGPENFQVKIIADENELIPNIFDRHQEAIIADLNCGNVPNIFSKVQFY